MLSITCWYQSFFSGPLHLCLFLQSLRPLSKSLPMILNSWLILCLLFQCCKYNINAANNKKNNYFGNHWIFFFNNQAVFLVPDILVTIVAVIKNLHNVFFTFVQYSCFNNTYLQLKENLYFCCCNIPSIRETEINTINRREFGVVFNHLRKKHLFYFD